MTDLSELREALTSHIQSAARRLRANGQIAGCLHVFLHTNRFKSEPQYLPCISTCLSRATNHTQPMLTAALGLLEQIYKTGYAFKKTGVLLTDLQPESARQLTFWDAKAHDQDKAGQLMQALDHINARYGRDTLQYASAGLRKGWEMRRDRMSPEFTTRWKDIPRVKA